VAFENLGDRAGLQASYGNQALILKDWGRLEDAMALRKKEEAIGLELSDRAGLGACRNETDSLGEPRRRAEHKATYFMI
jgi:hypothetical protein